MTGPHGNGTPGKACRRRRGDETAPPRACARTRDPPNRGRGLPADRPVARFERRPVPPARRGGYRDVWVAADALEHTSGATSGHVYDESDQRLELSGYRVDALTDVAIDRLGRFDPDRPFLMFVSFLEPPPEQPAPCHRPQGLGQAVLGLRPAWRLARLEGRLALELRSESHIGRVLRTATHTYALKAPTRHPLAAHRQPDHYVESHLYDNAQDPHQLHNLVKDPGQRTLRHQLAEALTSRILEVEGRTAAVDAR